MFVFVLLQAVKLKSDHFGIEIDLELLLNNTILELKSDHFGIEIVPWHALQQKGNGVKIRPFWD